jgi:hypothetical protein
VPFSLDRVGPLLIGCVFERRRENIASSARHGIEGTNFAEKRLQAVGVRNMRLTITGLAADRHNLVSPLLQPLFTADPTFPVPKKKQKSIAFMMYSPCVFTFNFPNSLLTCALSALESATSLCPFQGLLWSVATPFRNVLLQDPFDFGDGRRICY